METSTQFIPSATYSPMRTQSGSSFSSPKTQSTKKPICVQRHYDPETYSNRQQLLNYRHSTLNTIKASSILVKEKAAFRSGASSSMHVVVKTRYENLKVHIRGSKDHVRRRSLSAIRPLLLLVLVGRLSMTVSSFSFAGTNHHQVVLQCNIHS